MGQVKFNVDVVDSDSQIRYVASDEFVEVSDSFLKRLKSSDMYGKSFVSEEDEEDFEDDNLDTSDYSKEDLISQFKAHTDGLNEKIEDLKSELSELEASKTHEIEQRDVEIKDLKKHLKDVNSELETLKSTPNPDAEKQLVRDEYELLLGVKPGNKSIETMKAEIEAHKSL